MRTKHLILMGTTIFSLQQIAFASQDPCSRDVEKFCENTVPGRSRIGKCLKENVDKLSSGCAEYAMAVRELRKELKTACYQDVRKICPDILPGNGRVVSCLRSPNSKVSAECTQKFVQIFEFLKK